MKRKLLFIILVTLILFTKGCGKAETELFSYEDGDAVFQIEIPDNWECEKIEKFTGDESMEGLPDYGFRIYIDDNRENEIYFFRQTGHIAMPVYGGEEIQVTPHIKGTLYLEQGEEFISGNIVFENEFYGIWFHFTQECYDKNKVQIQEMINSIQIEEQS